MDAIKVMRYVANEADSVWFLLQQLDDDDEHDDVAYGQPSRWSLFLAAWITTLLLPHTHTSISRLSCPNILARAVSKRSNGICRFSAVWTARIACCLLPQLLLLLSTPPPPSLLLLLPLPSPAVHIYYSLLSSLLCRAIKV